MTYLILSAAGLIAAMVLAALLAWRVGLWAVDAGRRIGAESPVVERSSHTRPTSRLGGVALAAGFFGPMAALTALLTLIPRQPEAWGGNLPLLAWLALGAAGFFLVGLADDLLDLPPALKLAGQIASAAPAVLAGLRFPHLGLRPPLGMDADFFNALATLGWIVFFVNAFNFMDGMDGFAASFAKNVCLWLSLSTLLQVGARGEFNYLRLEFLSLPLLAAACAGFLRVNRPPARVFMGDGGSHLLGYLLAIHAPLAAQGRYLAIPDVAGARTTIPAGAVMILMLPFTFDVLLTLLRRSWRGEPLLQAHRSHLYQRLMAAGLTHAEVLRLNMRLFRACGLLSLAYAFAPWVWARAGLWALALVAMAGYWAWTLRREANKNQKAGPLSPCNQPEASS